jgi:RimJ/RimL family protein N-acetyltransferase
MSETDRDLTAFDRVHWPVRTERLSMRPVTGEDFPRLYEIRALPGVSHWLTGAPTSFDDYVERYGTPERMASTLVLETGDAIVGDLACLVESPWSQAEAREGARHSLASIGWCLDPAYGGRGYATEAAAELLRICFDEIGVRRVVAGAFADNIASVRVMEKIGMRIEARFREASLHRELGWLDGVEAGILADEWRAGRR